MKRFTEYYEGELQERIVHYLSQIEPKDVAEKALEEFARTPEFCMRKHRIFQEVDSVYQALYVAFDWSAIPTLDDVDWFILYFDYQERDANDFISFCSKRENDLPTTPFDPDNL